MRGRPRAPAAPLPNAKAASDRTDHASRDAGLVEGGHRRQRGDRGAQHRQRHRGAGAFAQPHPQVDDRFELELLQRQRVRGFGGPVTRLPPLPRAGREHVGDQRRRCHHHAVEQHRCAPHRGLRAEARHRGQIGAAAHPQQRERDRPSAARPRYSASRTAAVLRAQPASSMPVPRPTTATGSVSVSAAIKVVAAVVFPMPMSPAISRSAPASTSSSAIRRPASTAALRLVGRQRVLDGDVAAGPSHLVRADRRRRAARRRRPRCRPRALSRRPDSASTLIAAPPASKLATICAVTSAGYAETPGGGDAVVAGEHHHPGALELAAAGRRPGTPPPTPTGPRGGRASRAVWSAWPGGPAPRRRPRRRVRRSGANSVTHGSFTVTRLARHHQHHPIAQRAPAAG